MIQGRYCFFDSIHKPKEAVAFVFPISQNGMKMRSFVRLLARAARR